MLILILNVADIRSRRALTMVRTRIPMLKSWKVDDRRYQGMEAELGDCCRKETSDL